MLWEQPGQALTIEKVSALQDGQEWFSVQAGGQYPQLPAGVTAAWLKIKLPELTQGRPTLTIKKLYAQDVQFFIDNELLLERHRDYSFDNNEMIIPLSKYESHKWMYVRLVVNVDRLGLHHELEIGEYEELYKNYIKLDLIDVVLGTGLIFIAFFMMVSVIFLNRAFLPGWRALLMVMLSTGVMILTYSNFADKFFPEYGKLTYVLFDIAACFLLPSLFSFFQGIFGKGPYGIIDKFKKVLQYFTALYLLSFILGLFFDFFPDTYSNIGIMVFGILVIVGNLILLGSLAYHFKSKNKEAVILSAGIAIFASVGLMEILWYFYNDKLYKMFYWKISILCFLASLIIILVRRVMHNYEQAVQYSKQIEVFNNELQRTEKIELISNLAASIAHEVRNPLQVTRGFMQLLGSRTKDDKDKSYMALAIDELDRASEIITDFLTFAKPDLGEFMHLDISEEVQQIVAILAPFATMSGGEIRLQSEKKLYVRGNPSRFKQALINIIKNSIEAFGEEGKVEISAYRSAGNQILIKIKDNGEGISPDDLKRLGEPYYSKKTKGTGLGLMVTYRIVETMNGEIRFDSERGAGTQVSITLPAV
ncbi:ATP-binding protein [Paenibacillus sp. GCM10027627]